MKSMIICKQIIAENITENSIPFKWYEKERMNVSPPTNHIKSLEYKLKLKTLITIPSITSIDQIDDMCLTMRLSVSTTYTRT